MPAPSRSRKPTRSTRKKTTGRISRTIKSKTVRGGKTATTAPRAARASGSITKQRSAVAGQVKPRTVTPYLVVPDAAKAMAWYAEAFGAKELSRNMAPGGKIMHAAIQIGDSTVFLSDVFPGSDVKDPTALGGTCVNLHIYHRDIDKMWQQAVDAGANVTMQLANQFWGDRYGKILDPFGHSWAFGYEADMSEDEMERMQAQAMQMFAAGTGSRKKA